MSSLPVGRDDRRDRYSHVASGSNSTPSLHSSESASSSVPPDLSPSISHQTASGLHLGPNLGTLAFYCDTSDESSIAAVATLESGGSSRAEAAGSSSNFRTPQTPKKMKLKQSQETFSQKQSSNTPVRNSSHCVSPKTTAVEQEKIKALLKEEIGTRVFIVGATWAPSLYSNLVSDEKIDEFLQDTDASGYAWAEASMTGSGDGARTILLRGRWTALPGRATSESEIYEPLNTICAAIINDSSLSDNGTTRKVIDTHRVALMHDNKIHVTLPDMCICAEGPSFQCPPPSLSKPSQREKGVGYTNVAAVFDAKLESAKHQTSSQVLQMALYIR